MARVSQYSLDDKRTQELIGQLWNGLTLLEDRNEVKTFISKFLTPTEILMLAKRLELLKLADSDLEVVQLVRLTAVSKKTVYDWIERYDGFEENFSFLIDRLKNLDKKYLERLKDRIAKTERTKLTKRTAIGGELIKFGAAVVYKGYKKRQKRKSVLLMTE